MQAIKVELEGLTTSFRYPHFLVGRQPSLPMPPPSTIYGHIASALGEMPGRTGLRFGYSFSFATRCDDLETQQILEASTGKFDKQVGFVKNLEGKAGPGLREVLISPRLTLYVSGPDPARLLEAFRQPKYAVVLGRSQDLATYTSVQSVELEERTSGYLEGTLLPSAYRDHTNAGVLTQMPRYIDPDNRRRVEWEMYLVLENRALTTPDQNQARRSSALWEGLAPFWVDPTSPPDRNGRQRIVIWHSFSDVEDEN